MKLSAIFSLFLCVVLLWQPISAFETDQFNLPPQPLADIGDEVSEYVELNLKKAVEKVNNEIIAGENCLREKPEKPEKSKCESPEKTRTKLEILRSEETVARELYNLLGTGIPPFTASGSWMESHKFTGQPARYKTSFRKSIFFVFPSDYVGISSTVNLYGAQFGTDKIAHIFQQGYTYYKIYNRAAADGLMPAEAEKKVIKWGQSTERTIYGTLISGVYSNADLSANYAGMKFYQGLTREIKIGERIKPAALILQNGVWKINEYNDLRQLLIKPLISEHFNEALNPSIYVKGLRSFVRRTVRKQSCRQWRNQYPDLSQTDLNKTTERLKLWFGEDYGFTDSKYFVTIANTCFDNDIPNANKSES